MRKIHCAALLALAATCTLIPRAKADRDAYAELQKAYAPFTDPDDPLGFPMKIRAVSEDQYMFWRGTKDLFYQWCKQNTADWAADKEAYIVCHGDLHLGNMGTYARDGAFGKIAFGMIDFDESGRMPFQIELLQGVITLELCARNNDMTLSDAQKNELTAAMFDAYRNGLTSGKTASELLQKDDLIERMYKGQDKPYSKELKKYTHHGKFRVSVENSEGVVKDVLRPFDGQNDQFAQALADASDRDPTVAALFNYHTAAEFKAHIEDVARRTRYESAGSQGLRKYFVLLQKPLKGIDSDVIFYMKQEGPSAEERSGFIPMDQRPPAQRLAEDMRLLDDPEPFLTSWAAMEGRSYWVEIKLPWVDELAPDDVLSQDALLDVAKILGTVAGTAHGRQHHNAAILARLTPALLESLRTRGATYADLTTGEYDRFLHDPRTRAAIKKAEDALRQADAKK